MPFRLSNHCDGTPDRTPKGEVFQTFQTGVLGSGDCDHGNLSRATWLCEQVVE